MLQLSRSAGDSETMDFGAIEPSQADYEAWVERVRATVTERAMLLRTQPEQYQYREDYLPLRFTDYCWAIDQLNRGKSGTGRLSERGENEPGLVKLANMARHKDFTADLDGYLVYLKGLSKSAAPPASKASKV